MADKNLKLALIIEALVKGAKEVSGLTGNVKDLGAQASKKVPDNTDALRAGAEKTRLSVRDLTNTLGGLISLAAITRFSNNAVDEFAKAESAIRGLESVAVAKGVGIGNALKEAERLAADGLIGVSDASKALQNLLSRGYNLEQAVGTIERLKDAAAFNRQASLSMADAVVSATEGLKNENSVLVDNAGVTKNVAKIWEEYAKQRGLATTELTQAQKIEAEYLGIQKETEAQLGNTKKALAGYQGQMAESEQITRKFLQSTGEVLAPIKLLLSQVGNGLIEYLAKPIQFFFATLGIRIAQTVAGLGTLYDAIRNLDFSGVKEAIQEQARLAEEEMQRVALRLSNGGLSITEGLVGAADPEKMKEVADALKENAAAAAKAAQEQRDALKKSINESIDDYKRLAEFARKSWEEAGQAQKDALAEAAELETNARARPKDSSYEGQASATLDLIYAEQKLQRIKAQGNNLDEVKAQVKLVERLAGNLNNQARAQEALNNADLAKAVALRKYAAEQGELEKGLIEQQRSAEQVVKDLQAALDSIGKGTALKIESEQAMAVLDEITARIEALKDTTITIKAELVGPDGQSLDNLVAQVPGHATGTILPGYGGGDRRLILAEDGEAITRKEAVAYYGRDFLSALNAMRIPRFANGGLVMAATSGMASLAQAPSSPPAGQDFPYLGRLDLGIGGETVTVHVEAEMARILRRAALKVGD